MNREEYIFNSPPEDMRIDGGIMPVRDLLGDGSWRVLRGEDAFLVSEWAARFFAAANGIVDDSLTVVGANGDAWRLSRSVFFNAVDAMKRVRGFPGSANVGTVVNPDADFDALDQVRGTGATSLSAAYPSLAFTPSVTTPTWTDVLESDCVRRVYRDIEQFRVYCAARQSSTAFESWTSGHAESNVAEYPPLADGEVYAHYAGRGSVDGVAAWRERWLTGGSIRLSYVHDAQPRDAVRAVVMFALSWSEVDAYPGPGVQKSARLFAPLDCVVDGDDVVIDISQIVGDVLTWRDDSTSYDFRPHAWPPSHYCGSFTIRVSSVYIFGRLPSDFSIPTEWSWPDVDYKSQN